MPHEAFNNLLPHRESRVEGGHGLLKNHGHSIAAQILQLACRCPDQFLIFKLDGAASNSSRWLGQEAHDGQRGDAFAAARLAHNGQGLPCVHAETDTINCSQFTRVGIEAGDQVPDLKDGGCELWAAHGLSRA